MLITITIVMQELWTEKLLNHCQIRIQSKAGSIGFFSVEAVSIPFPKF